ncbi:MAG: Ldh family oxidoreductase [Ignavibacteriales bacterium]
MTKRRVSAQALGSFCEAVLERHGVPRDDAALISDSLVKANLRGVDSHGVARLPAYVTRVRAGLMNAVTRVAILVDKPSLLLLDGGNGFGQVAASGAMRRIIEKAGKTGVAVAGLRNTNHFGMGAYFAMIPAASGMIGIAVSNAPPAMAPTGGSSPVLGTNPLSVCVPCGDGRHVVLDMATTVVSRGKVRLAAREGKKIPPGWGLDASGLPTEDPGAVLKGGTLTPVGGPKGYGLAFVIDVLAGVITGAGFGPALKALDDLSGHACTGNFLAAVSVESFMPPAEFFERMESFAAQVKGVARAPGVERVYLPGEIEWEAEQERSSGGIPLSDEVLRDLNALGAEQDLRIEIA